MPTVEVVPDGDGATNDWSQPPSGDHYDEIDEGSGGPDSNYILASNSAGDDGDIEMFTFENPSFGGGVSSQVVIWTYGFRTGNFQPDVEILIGGESHGPESVNLGLVPGWTSNTFTPDADDWTELEATSLKLTYTAHCSGDKQGHTIYTCYALFTYPGYEHDYMGVPAGNIASVSGVPSANIDNIKGV